MTIVFDQQSAANSEPNSVPQQTLDPSTATGDALHWLAYQFISDELSDNAREAFGKRLMECQEAREAVAAAAELDGALRAVSHWPVELAESVEPVRRQVVAWKRAAAALALTVAALLAVLLWQPNGAADTPPADSTQVARNPDVNDLNDSQLAELWASQLHDVATPKEADPIGFTLAGSDSEPLPIEDSLTEIPSADWMWAALDASESDAALDLGDANEESL